MEIRLNTRNFIYRVISSNLIRGTLAEVETKYGAVKRTLWREEERDRTKSASSFTLCTIPDGFGLEDGSGLG